MSVGALGTLVDGKTWRGTCDVCRGLVALCQVHAVDIVHFAVDVSGTETACLAIVSRLPDLALESNTRNPAA